MKHPQTLIPNLRILPKNKICSRLKGDKHVKDTHVAPISLDIGTEQQTQFEQQNKTKTSRIRDHAQYVHTIQIHQSHNQQTKSNTQFKKKYHKLDSHILRHYKSDPYLNGCNAHTTHLDSFPSETHKKGYLETSPTLSFMEVLLSLKKKRERERERRVDKVKELDHNPLKCQLETITTRNEREKGKKSGILRPGNKPLQYLPNLRADKHKTNFFFLSHSQKNHFFES